jgi:hypothetical protein
MRVFLFLSFLFYFNSSSAQHLFKVQAGLVLSKMSNYRTINTPFHQESQKTSLGIQLGFVAETKIQDRLSILAELMYTQKGSVSEDISPRVAVNDPNNSYTLSLSYVELPLLLRYNGWRNIFVTMGPSLGMLVDANYENQNPLLAILPGVSPNVTRYYSKMDVGANIGLSYQTRKFEIGARYTHGLSDVKIVTPSTDPEFSYSSILPVGRNRVLQFHINYIL